MLRLIPCLLFWRPDRLKALYAFFSCPISDPPPFAFTLLQTLSYASELFLSSPGGNRVRLFFFITSSSGIYGLFVPPETWLFPFPGSDFPRVLSCFKWGTFSYSVCVPKTFLTPFLVCFFAKRHSFCFSLPPMPCSDRHFQFRPKIPPFPLPLTASPMILSSHQVSVDFFCLHRNGHPT